jgi:hypothetical protein
LLDARCRDDHRGQIPGAVAEGGSLRSAMPRHQDKGRHRQGNTHGQKITFRLILRYV